MNALKQKLSSRKLWIGLLAIIASLVTMCLGEEMTPEITDALKYLVSACGCYIFGESIVDAARQKYRVDLSGLFNEESEAEEKEQTAEENQTEEI